MKIVVVGAGRTGSHAAELIAPKLRAKDELAIVDRDILEQSNLKGCTLYLKKELGKPKAQLLAQKVVSLTKGKTTVTVFGEHLSPENISAIFGRGKNAPQVVLDCTDNWQTRILINEYCWKNWIPWVYCGALRSRAMCTTIVPRVTPCFACWSQKPVAVESCNEVGVDTRALQVISRAQVNEALSILRGRPPILRGKLLFFQNNHGDCFEKIVKLPKNNSCLFCVGGKSLYSEEGAIVACGGSEWMFRNNFNVASAKEMYKKLEGFERKVVGEVVKVRVGKSSATVFTNGRVIVNGKNREHASAANQAIAQKIS